MKFWIINVWINVIASIFVVVWFTIGGVIDLKAMSKRLETMTRDSKDDGFVANKE